MGDRIVKPPATVQAFDPLCEVQSDKASVEITSPYDGVVKELLVQEGEVAKVGSGLCLIEVEAEGAEIAEPEPVGSLAAPARPFHALDPYNPNPKIENVLAAPSVRHYARQKAVDLSLLVPGSGKDGRIEKADVEAYVSRSAQPMPSPPAEGQDVVVELGRTRYGMWKAMVKVSLLNSFCPDSQFFPESRDSSLWIFNYVGYHCLAQYSPSSK